MLNKKIQINKYITSYLDNQNIQAKSTILFCHANGYSAGCYQYYFRRLSNNYRLIGLDFLNHGQSETNLKIHNWNLYREQIIGLIKQLSLSNVTGIGHSLGGSCLLMASYSLQNNVFSKIICLDPVLLNPAFAMYSRLFGHPMAYSAKKRRTQFTSQEHVEKIFRKHPTTRHWHQEVLQDYFQSCFYEIENKEVRLLANSLAEYKTFKMPNIMLQSMIKKINTPQYYIMPSNSAVCPNSLIQRIAEKDGSCVHTIFDDSIGHLFPFEKPEWTLQQIRTILHGNL